VSHTLTPLNTVYKWSSYFDELLAAIASGIADRPAPIGILSNWLKNQQEDAGLEDVPADVDQIIRRVVLKVLGNYKRVGCASSESSALLSRKTTSISFGSVLSQ